MNRELNCELIFYFCNYFWLLFDKFFYNFYLYLKSIRCVYQRLVLKFENDLNRVYVVVEYNIDSFMGWQ